ncbi:MAG: PLP-dependent aminotransferase family protein [Candidatus Handelsmanbacteria bacterium]|nr:PLP-dependent aminotransferase family protein [Candidatus Handelsmanbacteria bacterium]
MRVYDFGSGRTDPGSFPTAQLAEAARQAVLELGPELVKYPGEMGHLGLRQVMAAREARREGVAVSSEHMVLTNGSMQGVTLVAEALMRGPGDVIVTEEYTYSGTIGAYKGLGARLVGVPQDEEGMCVDALDETLTGLERQGTSPAFVYTLTTYQNPTGAVMSTPRRRQLIEVARKHQVIVVEDNCYGDVHFEGPVPPTLYALDPELPSVYLCSLSKILGPGLRLGYLLARPPLLERLLDRRYDGGNSALAAAICATFFRDRLWDHVAHTNGILREKRDTLFVALEENLGDICTWTRPVGGMFLWVGFPKDVGQQKLAALAAERGVIYARGSAFHVHNEPVPFLRLAFGFCSLADIREGIPVLGECIRQARAGVLAAT